MYKYGKRFVSSITLTLSKPFHYESASKIDDSETKRPADSKTVASTCNSSSPLSGLPSKKRVRHDGHKTPLLVYHSQSSDFDSMKSTRPLKKKKIAGAIGQSQCLLFQMIPQEVLETHVFTFLTDGRDFHSLQLVSKVTKMLSDKTNILSDIDLSGDAETGKGSILQTVESPAVAVERLYKFASAENLQALYMVGMIAAYCHGDEIGVTILKKSAKKGCLRSAYALGLILRDCNKAESEKYLNGAIAKEYLPACQELLSSQTVKDRFGDLDHLTLKKYFDPIGLNRLLGRCYLQGNGVRVVATSHCWNPCCGRWALKANQPMDGSIPQLQDPSTCLPALAGHTELSLVQLAKDEGNSLKSKYADDSTTCSSISNNGRRSFRVSRMKMCSSCRRAKYCSKLCQVYDWRSGRHKMECQYL
mmetsp:Transcript_14916/g.17020  ORF Transcript_14916/g.17020 Transcript_14916/m.17020 type:complete len:418 (-) Transcript_14916:686-1939(-)